MVSVHDCYGMEYSLLLCHGVFIVAMVSVHGCYGMEYLLLLW